MRCALATAFVMLGWAAAAQQPAFDLLIVNGRMLDGTGNPWMGLDIGVRDGAASPLLAAWPGLRPPARLTLAAGS
jgi:hypothetical protein